MSALGSRGFLGIAPETSWGTPVAAAAYFEAMSESIVKTIDRFPVRNIYGGIYEPDDETGLHHHQGNVVLSAHPVSIGYFLKGALGLNSIAVLLSGSLFRNDFTMAQTDDSSLNALPPYTLEVCRDVSSSQQFAGVQFNSISLGVAVNQDVRATVGVIAKSVTSIAKSTSTPTFPNSPSGPFKFNNGSLSIAGVANARLEAMTLTIDGNIQGIGLIDGTTNVGRINRAGAPSVRVSGTVSVDDLADYEAFVNQTEQRWVATFTKANSFAMVLDMPRVVFSNFPLQIAGRDRITVNFDAMARYHVGSGTPVKISLTTTNTF